MRVSISCLALLLSLPAIAEPELVKLGKIVQELDERGLLPAYITIEYSLTDDCDFADLRVTKNSHPDVLGPDAVDEIVSEMIGPFSDFASADELLQFSSDNEFRPNLSSSTTRLFSWTTDDGHRYVVCRFYSNGELESARLTDGHGPQFGKKIDDLTIGGALSEMGPREIDVAFMPEDRKYNFKLPKGAN